MFWNVPDIFAQKIRGNKELDKRVTRELRKLGWVVVRVWEHELKIPQTVSAKLKKITCENRK